VRFLFYNILFKVFYVFLQLLPVVNRLYIISSNPAYLVVALRSKRGIIKSL
jgi:hypothetical protein